MKFELKLALRYFLTGRSKLVRFTSVAAVAGIAVGVASFIFAQAIGRGFEEGIRTRVLESTGHITVRETGEFSASKALMISRIGGVDDVRQVIPTTFEASAVFIGGQNSYAVIRVLPDSSSVFGPDDNRGNEQHPGVFLGKRLFFWPESDATPSADLVFSTDDGIKREPVRIEGSFETGIYDYDSTWVYIRETDYIKLKGIAEFHPDAYIVYVEDPFRSGGVRTELQKEFGGGAEVVDWQEANKPLFSALALERRIALWVIALIVIVAALNITTTLALLVRERLPDLAILRTCGATSRMLGAVFLLEGWILALAGISLGIASGIAFSVAAGSFRWISLPEEVYSLSSIEPLVEPLSVASAAFAAFVVCTVATAFPVIRAMRTKPLENLRLK